MECMFCGKKHKLIVGEVCRSCGYESWKINAAIKRANREAHAKRGRKCRKCLEVIDDPRFWLHCRICHEEKFHNYTSSDLAWLAIIEG